MLFYKCAQLVEYSGTCVHTLILAGGCDSLVILLHDNQGWGVSPEANVYKCDCTACQYSHAGASSNLFLHLKWWYIDFTVGPYTVYFIISFWHIYELLLCVIWVIHAYNIMFNFGAHSLEKYNSILCMVIWSVGKHLSLWPGTKTLSLTEVNCDVNHHIFLSFHYSWFSWKTICSFLFGISWAVHTITKCYYIISDFMLFYRESSHSVL